MIRMITKKKEARMKMTGTNERKTEDGHRVVKDVPVIYWQNLALFIRRGKIRKKCT